MAKNFVITVIGDNDQDPIRPGSASDTVARVCTHLKGIVGGCRQGTTSIVAESSAVKAESVILLSSSVAGQFTVTVNGVAFTTALTTGVELTDATAMAALINASSDPLVVNHVVASAVAGSTAQIARVYVTAKTAGHAGNLVTLALTGTTATNITFESGVTGGRMTGGSSTKTTFSY